ncbi:MAG: PilN domain-containing protein [Solirubrobacteraceae bacterium]
MRAVNLMPNEAGWGGGSRPTGSSSSIGGYAVLAVLGALVVFAALWTVTNNQIDSRTAKLGKANAEAQAAEQRAQAAAPYIAFAELARNRKATVTSLSATRFDWAHGLREISRVVPNDVWLSALDGTSGASVAAPGPTTSAAPAPRFEMKGCTHSQANVARLMARLRAVDGVRSVELMTSAKPDEGGDDDCPANKSSDPAFTIAISFGVPGEPKATVDSTGQIPAAAPATSSSSDPAASTPSGDQNTTAKG